jgi:hypothetical protein
MYRVVGPRALVYRGAVVVLPGLDPGDGSQMFGWLHQLTGSHVYCLIDRNRRGQVEALDVPAAELLEPVELQTSLDAFNDRAEAE